jgi:hypothetical protein
MPANLFAAKLIQRGGRFQSSEDAYDRSPVAAGKFALARAARVHHLRAQIRYDFDSL